MITNQYTGSSLILCGCRFCIFPKAEEQFLLKLFLLMLGYQPLALDGSSRCNSSMYHGEIQFSLVEIGV